MAKYNLSRFNLAKYNRSVDSDVVFDKMQLNASFLAQVGLGQKTKDILRLDAVVSGQMKAAAGTLDQVRLTAAITSEIVGKYIVYGRDTIAAEFAVEISAAAIVMGTDTLSAVLEPEAYLSPKVRDLGLRADAEISCNTYLGNLIMDPNPMQVYGIFGSVVSAESLEEIIIDLSVTIKPGDILVIDSDNFRVLLNGENAIKYHSGDWIDELNRQSKSITISGGGDTLESSIYFQELWL